MSHIVLRGCWCNIIVLNVHPTRKKSDDLKDRFYKELGQVFDHLPKYSMKILLVYFNAKVERENIFKPKTGNDTLNQDSNNNNGVTTVNLATSKNLLLRASCSHTDTFISSPVPLLMGSLTTRLITYGEIGDGI